MANLVYLLAAYTIIWGLVFGYVFFIFRRQRRLRREIEYLRELLAKDNGGAG